MATAKLTTWRKNISRELVIFLVILLTTAVCSILFPYSFRSLANFQAVLRGLAVDGMLSVGMTLLLVAGVFDLSVGSAMSLAGVVAAWLMKVAGWPPALAIGVAVVVGIAGGTLNGLVVAKARVNALIATLAAMGIFQGIAVLVGGPGIEFLPPSYTRTAQAEFLGVQTPVWLMAAVALIGHYLLAHTRLFRQFYFIGSNAKAARLSGINVERMQIVGFAVMGGIAALAGVAFAGRVGAAVSNAGNGAELRVITAVILGGASLTGGKGTVWGALLGVVFMALLGNVLLIAHVSSYWQGIVLGVVLILAVAIDSWINPKRD